MPKCWNCDRTVPLKTVKNGHAKCEYCGYWSPIDEDDDCEEVREERRRDDEELHRRGLDGPDSFKGT